MPRFLDHHPTSANLPPELITVIRQRLHREAVDEFGGRELNVFVGPRSTYCLTDAPTAEAVRSSHKAIGIDLDPADIEEVLALPDTPGPISTRQSRPGGTIR